MKINLGSRCDDCKLKDECRYFYPCEADNIDEIITRKLGGYAMAWDKLKDFVEALQEGHENTYAYSNEYIDYVLDEMNQLEERLKL